MNKKTVGSALKNEIQVFGDEFWEVLRIKQGRPDDVWDAGSHFAWPELKLITLCLKFLISNGYDLRRADLLLFVWILLQVPTEDRGPILDKIHINIRRDVVAMISVVHRASTKDTWLDLASSAFLKEVTGQEPARIGEEVVERFQSSTAHFGNPNPPSATIAPSGDSGSVRDPNTTIHCV